MIRPFTLACIALAAGSGLYMFQTKQAGRLRDRQIHDVREATDTSRRRAEVLHAEYELLQDPTRLAELVAAHLPDLKSTQPPQWTSLAELDRRLPPVGTPVAAPAPLEPAAMPTAALPEPAPAPAAVAALPPHAAAPHPAPVPAPVAAPAIIAHAPAPHQILALAREPAPRAAAPALPVPARPNRGVAPVMPVLAALHTAAPAATAAEAIARIARGGPVDPSVPVVASALGMARAMALPQAISPASAATPDGLPR